MKLVIIRNLFRISVCLLVLSFSSAFAQQRISTKSKSVTVDKKVNTLLAKMTLAEKLGQLQILDGEANGKFRPEHLELARKGLLGSTLNVRRD